MAWRRIFPPMPSPLPDLMVSLSRSNSSPRFLLCAQNEGSNYTPCPCPQPYFIYKEKEKADRRSRRFVPTPKKVSPFLPFFFIMVFLLEYIFSDMWITGRKKKSNHGERNGNYSCHKSSLFLYLLEQKIGWELKCSV